jgi:hypothetical protein
MRKSGADKDRKKIFPGKRDSGGPGGHPDIDRALWVSIRKWFFI